MVADRNELARKLELLATDLEEGMRFENPDTRYDIALLRQAATALSQDGWQTPKGWKLVPLEITEDMANAMECEFSTEAQWRVALKEAPPPPKTGDAT